MNANMDLEYLYKQILSIILFSNKEFLLFLIKQTKLKAIFK